MRILTQLRCVLYILNTFLYQPRAYAAYHIIKKKTFRSPGLFENRTKHKNSEHIKEEVGKPSVHKHVSDKLRRIKIAG
ncbi:hypothetical protein JCM10003_1130 [Bacteroides pyogenes JCM 10003]|nr:hypothetical protein JCM10003_1130 [Bacteroides pyogenes JCM 10003]